MSYSTGKTISFYTAVTNPEYILDDIIIMTASGEEIEAERNDFAWIFTMPDENVDVYASFVEWKKEENAALKDEIMQNLPNVIEENDTIIPSDEYILTNIDTQYAKANKLEPIDILYVKNTLADATYLKDKDIDEIFDDKEPLSDIIIGQTDTYIFLYNTDDDSDFYVAYANQMENDINSIVKDYSFAYTNNDGEVINDAIYDYKTGLAYVPKSYQLENRNGYGAMNVQLQLLQVINSEVPTNIINIFIEMNSRVKGCVAASGVIAFDSVCKNIEFLLAKDEKARKSIKEDYISVDLNANGINTENFTYNEDTGILTVEASPLSVNEIVIKIEKPSFMSEETTESSVKNEISYVNYTDVSEWNTTNIQVGNKITLTGTISYINEKNNQDIKYHFPIGSTADNGLELWKAIKEMNNDCFNQTDFSELSDWMQFTVTVPGGTYSCYDDTGEITGTINIPTSSFIIKSAYINKMIEKDLYPARVKMYMRILAISEDEIWIGLVTDTSNVQSVSGIYVIGNNNVSNVLTEN